MLKKLSQNNQLKISILVTAIFYVLAHGYRFSNNMYSYDSLLTLYQNDYSWQIAIGRIFIPVLIFLRGSLCNPWLISMITILWTSLSVYFTVKILEIEEAKSIILIAGVYAINPVTIVMNASYIIDVDLYALACMLAVLSVYLFKIAKTEARIVCYILSAVALMVSLGIYQAYVCMAVGLMMLLFFKDLSTQKALKNVLLNILKMIVVMLVAAVAYYVFWKIFQRVFHIWTSDSYNGLANVGDFSQFSIFGLVSGAYKEVWKYFVDPTVYQSLMFRGRSLSIIIKIVLVIMNIALLIATMVKVILSQIKGKLPVWQILFQWIILILFPFGVNIVFFISKGMEHTLMIYAFNLIYVLAVFLYQKNEKVIVLPIIVFVWVNFVFANQVYLKKELLDESAHSLMTRLVTDVEDVEGYIPGETPVVIYGSFGISPHIPELKDFEEVVCFGMAKSNISYVDLDFSYLQHILNVDMVLERVDRENIELMSRLENMPCYPEQGSIIFVDDSVVIKVSEY